MKRRPPEGPRERRPKAISAEEREIFLAAIGHGWTVRHAAEEAGHPRSTFYLLREKDEEFAAAWTQTLEAGVEVLEDEARRRAVEGFDESTYDAEGKPSCRELIRQFKSAPVAVDGMEAGEAIDRKWEGEHGHAVAAARYSAMSRPGPSQPQEYVIDPRVRSLRDVWGRGRRDGESYDW